jgi:hypothetical protein
VSEGAASHRALPVSKTEKAAWLALMALLMMPAVIPALTRDIGALAYDAATEHIFRGVVFSNAISEGVLYPRWVQHLHLGLGSPLFTFQPPLPYYGMDILARLALSHPLGWRVLIVLGFALAFGGMYLLVRDLTGRRWPALAAATAYLYAPYVLRNALERGSNEAFSIMLYPLVLWGLLWVARAPSAGRFITATLIWAACIASHVLGPLMLFPFAVVFAILLAWRHRTLTPIGVLLAGGLLTAVIWAPMWPEQAWVHVERDFTHPEAIPAQNPIPLDRLLAPPPVYDTAGDNNNSGDRIGLLHTAALAGGLLGAVWAWRRNRRLAWALLAASAAGVLLLWMFTAASDPIWQVAGPLLGRLLYRTRLMGVQALAAAGAVGLLVCLAPERRQRTVALAVVGLFVVAALSSLYVEYQHRWTTFTLPADLAQARAGEVRMGGSALTAFGEFTPRWRAEPFDLETGATFDAGQEPLAEPETGLEVLAAQVRDGAWSLTLRAGAPTTATLNLLYYPRWEASLDDAPVALSPQPVTGLAQVAIPAGEHVLALRYGSTAAELAGLAVSTATILALVGLGVWARGRQTPVVALPSNAGREAPPTARLLGATAVLLVLKFAVMDPATTLLRCSSTADRVCGAQTATAIPFAGGHTLRGYTVKADGLEPGRALRVDLYWEGNAGARPALNSFVHVRNSRPDGPMNPRTDNELWAQDEHVAPGGFPSTDYAPGKLYADSFRLRLPEDMPPGEYFLEIGWFDPATGEQLDPQADAVQPPLGILWRSVLLPNVQVR